MTKDSICKGCRWQKRFVYQGKGVEGDLLAIEEQRSCKQMVDGDMSDDVKVLECSEFESWALKPKLKTKPERFQSENVGMQKEK